jgi:hypothetical protein
MRALRRRTTLFVVKFMLRASVSKQIDGLWLGCFDKKLSASAFCCVEKALQLIVGARNHRGSCSQTARFPAGIN